MEVFVELSFRWLNLEDFYLYAIQQKNRKHLHPRFSYHKQSLSVPTSEADKHRFWHPHNHSPIA
ncbi:MAG: hypothetical protein GDA51_03220 [Ekhidna sp.]|nr:hypothetical protein [Ekhidna sp.]